MSKQRSLRKSKLSFDEEEDDDQGSIAVPLANVKAAQQSKIKSKRSNKKSAVLSFEEDPVQNAIQQKPAKIPSGISPSLHAPPLHSASTYTQVSAAGEYTAERLKELQRNTKRIPATTTTTSTTKEAAYDMVGDQLNHEHLLVEDIENDDDIGSIPDAAMVQRAKAERDRLRNGIAPPEYGAPTDLLSLKLDKLRRNVRNQTGHPLQPQQDIVPQHYVEEDDAINFEDVGHEPEERNRMKFYQHGYPDNDIAIRADRSIETGEDDEVEAVWAEEQIRKGMASALHIGSGRTDSKKKSTAAAAASVRSMPMMIQSSSTRSAIDAAAEKAFAALRSGLQQAHLTHQQSEKNYSKIESSMAECLASITRTKEELHHAGGKYAYFQRLRAYVADLCAMLAEKSPIIEELQDRLQEADEERAAMHRQRTSVNNTEEREPAEAGASAAIQVLSHGGTLSEASVAAKDASHTAEQRLLQGHHIPEDLDEFGRDMNARKRAMTSARLHKKLQRAPVFAAAAEAEASALEDGCRKEALGFSASHPGDVTSSDSEDEVTRHESRYRNIRDAAWAVMKDVDEEFATIAAVKATFEEWKHRYARQYHDVYMPVTLPALFAPFVRLELLGWRPLDVTSEGFDAHEWYQELFNYGMDSTQAEEKQHEGGVDADRALTTRKANGGKDKDPDSDLVPRLVQSLILPLAMHTVEKVWNPKSTRQSRATSRMLEDLLIYVPPNNQSLQELIAAVRKRLENAVEEATIPSWPPAALTASGRAEAFAARQFGRGLRLVRSACSFDEALPASYLKHLVLDALVEQRLMTYVRSAASDPSVLSLRAMRVLDALPISWCNSGEVGMRLRGLVELMMAVGRSLEGDCGYEERRMAKSKAAKGVARVLVTLGEVQAGNRLAMLFGVSLDQTNSIN